MQIRDKECTCSRQPVQDKTDMIRNVPIELNRPKEQQRSRPSLLWEDIWPPSHLLHYHKMLAQDSLL